MTFSSDSRGRLCLSLLGLLCLAASLAAQQEARTAAAEPREVFQETIGVEVVNIDVVVTDKKGRPVEGLTRDDFELRIDGREAEIANFYAVTAAAAPQVPAVPQEDAWQAVAPAAPREPIHLVVYVDGFYLTPISRRKVLEDLPGFFAEQVAAGARIMVATHARGLRLLTPFTRDLGELTAALARVDEAPAVGMQQTTARRTVLGQIRSVYEVCEAAAENLSRASEQRDGRGGGGGGGAFDPCEECAGQMVELARFYSLGVTAERRGAVAALGQLVNALSVLDGRKALLHVSDGIQQQAGLDVFYYVAQICPRQEIRFQEYYMRQDIGDLDDVIAQANASRVTFYAIEAAGVRNYTAASAEWDDFRFRPSPINDQIRIANLQSTLHYLSADTGGKAVLNAGDFTADLAKIGGELGSYYSLGYQPQHAGRGRTHRVGVKVQKKSYQVRYRRTFLHKKPEQQLADRALGVALFGTTENPLAAEVRAGAQSPASEGRVVVPLEISVPLASLTLIPEDGARRGRLTVIVAAPDKKGKNTVVRKQEIAVTVPPAGGAAAGDPAPGHYRFGVNVELAPGDYHLGVGIWDDVAASGSFLGLQVRAGIEDEPASGAPSFSRSRSSRSRSRICRARSSAGAVLENGVDGALRQAVLDRDPAETDVAARRRGARRRRPRNRQQAAGQQAPRPGRPSAGASADPWPQCSVLAQ